MKKIKLFEEFVKESLKSETPNEVITIELDMAWDPADEKEAKAAFKKYKIKVDGTGEPGTYDVTGKKKDILAYLQSEFYEMDDETIEEYYPELLESVVNEDKIKMALDNIDKWMPDDAQLQDEYYELINDADIEGMRDFLDTYAEEDGLMKYGIKYKDLDKLAKAIIGESVRLTESTDTATKKLADEVAGELFVVEPFSGSVKATTTTKKWDDGVPVLKYLARGNSKAVNVTINRSFELVHDYAHGWFYFTDGRTWYGLHTSDGYNDVQDLPFANVKVVESVVTEAKDFTQMALEILGDISQEFDPWEIGDMLPKDAEDTVDAYYPKWNSADKKKLAKELLNYANQPDMWVSEAKKFKTGDTWLWKHVDGDKEVEITDIKPNGDVIGKIKGTSDEFIVRDAGKYLKKKLNEAGVVLDGGWVNTKAMDWVDHTRVIKWIHNELDDKATMTRDGKGWNIDTSRLLPKQIKDLIHYLKSQKLLVEDQTITEAKTMDRDEMMIHLEDKYKFGMVRPSEEFDGGQGGIWVSGENGETLGGKRIYDYYATGAAYELGVLKKYEQAINKLGWYSEWYDAGTVMIWPN